MYSENNKIVYKKNYEYKTFSQTPIRAVCYSNVLLGQSFSDCRINADAALGGWTGVAYHIYDESYLVVKETEHQYNANGEHQISIGKEYDYNNYGFLNKTTYYNSNNSKETQYLTYSCDEVLQNNIFYKDMLKYNYLNKQVEKTQVINNKVINSELLTYKKHNNRFVLDKVYKMNLSTPLPYQYFLTYNGDTKDQHYEKEPKIEYTKYDKFNNLLECNNNNIYNSYIWSYNSLYPVAKIVNVQYSNVESILGGTNLAIFVDELTLSDLELQHFFSRLTNNMNSTNQITYYNYKPFIGISSITDSRGIITKYEYDTFGRLQNIKDYEFRKTTEYEYQYTDAHPINPTVYFNTEQSQFFKKNNCPETDKGPSVLYTVSAGKYKSRYSVEDANYLAKEDLRRNGQEYANTHGECSTGISYWNNPNLQGVKIKEIRLFEIKENQNPIPAYLFDTSNVESSNTEKYSVKPGIYHIYLVLENLNMIQVVGVLSSDINRCAESDTREILGFNNIKIDSFFSVSLAESCP